MPKLKGISHKYHISSSRACHIRKIYCLLPVSCVKRINVALKIVIIRHNIDSLISSIPFDGLRMRLHWIVAIASALMNCVCYLCMGRFFKIIQFPDDWPVVKTIVKWYSIFILMNQYRLQRWCFLLLSCSFRSWIIDSDNCGWVIIILPLYWSVIWIPRYSP